MPRSIDRIVTPAGDDAWLVRGYDLVRSLLGDPRLGRSHPDPANAPRYTSDLPADWGSPLSDEEGDEQDALRGVLVRRLSPQNAPRLRAMVDRVAGPLLDGIADGPPPVDLHARLSARLPVLVICELLGVPPEESGPFLTWAAGVAGTVDGERWAEDFAGLWAELTRWVERRRDEPRTDLLSDLLTCPGAPSDGREEAVARLATRLLFAGNETTVSAIDNGLLLLWSRPGWWTGAAGPDGVARAVEEILRLWLASVPGEGPQDRSGGGLPRWANADVGAEGALIRAGDLVLLDVVAANVDPERFRCPAEFDPDRPAVGHLSFGHGPQYCIGAALARIELQAVVSGLRERLPGIRLAADPASLRRQGIARSLASLPVTW